MAESKSEHVTLLARELLDDIELSRLSAEQLLLKSTRLAGSDEMKKWLSFEIGGFNSKDEISLRYMSKTGRWTDYENKKGYWVPLAQLDASIKSQEITLKIMTMPDTSGGAAMAIMHAYQKAVSAATGNISKLSGIRSRVLGLLHSFVTEIHYEKEFDNLAESIFEKYKSDIDALIAGACGDVLEQIPSVMSRLAEEHPESISQALLTIRRIIESFADAVYPPTEEKIIMGGNEVSLAANRYLNRINAFVYNRISSKSRIDKIRQNLSNLFERASVGVHSEVSAEEAKSLFLNTYLILGEVLHIGKLNVLDGIKD